MPLLTTRTSFKDKVLERTSNKSAANTALTVSSPAAPVKRLLKVTIKYSDTPVQSGAIVTLNSGISSDFDVPLATGSANAQSTVYIPDEKILLAVDDVIDVFAPAGGGVITSATAIYMEDA